MENDSCGTSSDASGQRADAAPYAATSGGETSWPPSWTYGVKNLTPPIDAYLKNNSAKFHPNPIWNDGALGFFEERRPNVKNNK